MKFFQWLGTPFRKLADAARFLVDLTPQQMRSVFSLSMIGGMIALTGINVWYTYRAERAVKQGEAFKPFFALLVEQVRIYSGLIGWFAVIMGLIVFGADYLRAKWGDKEVGLGKGQEDKE